jgi:hypothetical protein
MTFSLLLNDPADFEGGGTYFEGAGGRVWRPQQGVAVLHSGKVRRRPASPGPPRDRSPHTNPRRA